MNARNETHATLESQLGNQPCLITDTEEMFWLRESDDYASRVRLGNLLAAQYRFRDAAEAYRQAARIRADDPMLYLRLGGACLTLLQFDEAENAYRKCRRLGGTNQMLAYPTGVRHYLLGEYDRAADRFASALPCPDEEAVAMLYWHALSCLRAHTEDRLSDACRADMQVGHHRAYKDALEVILGKVSAEDAFQRAEQTPNALDAVIALYGIAVYWEECGRKKDALQAREALLARSSVWPCVSYLAAWNDRLHGI